MSVEYCPEDYCFDAQGSTTGATVEQPRPTTTSPAVEQSSPSTAPTEEYAFDMQGSTETAVMQPSPTTTPAAFVDELITKVIRSPTHAFTQEISDQEIRQLCNATIDVFQQQPTLVRIQPPVIVCGDIHGQFSDLQRIFATHGFPPRAQYLFLGDYVDRGPQSMETIILLFCYKVKYPANFILLRGNHECSNINKTYGFLREIQQRYRQGNAQQLFDLFNQTFAWMPYVGLIGNKILCMHGGISDKINSLQQLGQLHRPQAEPPLTSLEIDLLWADPKRDIRGVQPNTRGAGVVFGEDVVTQICQLLDVNYIIRAHQVVQDGVDYFANRQMITLFSAPRYANQYHNTGATLSIAEDLSHSITRFPPA